MRRFVSGGLWTHAADRYAGVRARRARAVASRRGRRRLPRDAAPIPRGVPAIAGPLRRDQTGGEAHIRGRTTLCAFFCYLLSNITQTYYCITVLVYRLLDRLLPPYRLDLWPFNNINVMCVSRVSCTDHVASGSDPDAGGDAGASNEAAPPAAL